MQRFFKLPEVAARFKPLRPKVPRKIDLPLIAQPQSKRYMLVGTAFDYLLRFELQRRAHHAVASRWVAENAPNIIWRKLDKGAVGIDLLQNVDPNYWLPPEEVAERARRIVEKAKVAVSQYIGNTVPSISDQMALAEHAIRLAKLDDVVRALRLDALFQEVDIEDVQDLIDLLAVVPFEKLVHNKTMLLNPEFRTSQGAVDADLITGNMLVEFKTTKNCEIDPVHLDQLLGYFILTRYKNLTAQTFPLIDRLGIYFCRHGHVWTFDAEVWTKHPLFQDTEHWFIDYAEGRMPS